MRDKNDVSDHLAGPHSQIPRLRYWKTRGLAIAKGPGDAVSQSRHPSHSAQVYTKKITFEKTRSDHVLRTKSAGWSRRLRQNRAYLTQSLLSSSRRWSTCCCRSWLPWSSRPCARATFLNGSKRVIVTPLLKKPWVKWRWAEELPPSQQPNFHVKVGWKISDLERFQTVEITFNVIQGHWRFMPCNKPHNYMTSY